MALTAAPTATSTQLGYARVSTEHQSLDQQVDALAAAGVEGNRVYSDKLSGTSTRQERPGLAALLDYAREGDAIVVVGIDRLGRNAAEVMTTIRELGKRGIVLRSLREGIDTSNATGRMVAGVLASLAELELELGRERRAAAREARRARGQSIGRPKALDDSKTALAQRMYASGESLALLRPPAVSVAPPSTACWPRRVMTGTSRSCNRSARTDSIPVLRTRVCTAQVLYLERLTKPHALGMQ
jgi:DNA invertase Pin-like site-specific DNA recombinase